MEKGGVSNYIHIRMCGTIIAKTLHGIFMSLRLSHIKRNLMFKVFPIVSDCIVHMYRIPDNISQKADGIFMERDSIVNDHAPLFLIIFPEIYGHNLPRRTVNNLPPSFSVISGIDHHQFFGNTLHKRNHQLRLHCGIKSSHHIALLYLIRVCFCPLIILPRGIISSIYFCPGLNQFFRELCTITVTDGISSPAVHQFYCFRHNIQISWNGYPSLCYTHRYFPPAIN